MAAIEQAEEAESIGRGGRAEGPEHLQLPELGGLRQVRTLLLVELDAHAWQAWSTPQHGGVCTINKQLIRPQ